MFVKTLDTLPAAGTGKTPKRFAPTPPEYPIGLRRLLALNTYVPAIGPTPASTKETHSNFLHVTNSARNGRGMSNNMVQRAIAISMRPAEIQGNIYSDESSN